MKKKELHQFRFFLITWLTGTFNALEVMNLQRGTKTLGLYWSTLLFEDICLSNICHFFWCI